MVQPERVEFHDQLSRGRFGGIVAGLQKSGVQILKGPESYENGKFVWIIDPEGNKVELWEPKIWDERNKGR